MSFTQFLTRLCVTTLAVGAAVSAAPLEVGFLSFDRSSPIDGENSISVNNFTGTASGLGCGQLDPQFPVCDSLQFSGTLDVTFRNAQGTFSMMFPLGGLMGPGTETPAGATFSADTVILSAVLGGTISPTLFHLPGNDTFIAGPAIISQMLSPGGEPGPADIALLTVEPSLTSIPEPATYTYAAIFLGFAVVCWGRRQSRRETNTRWS